jgi:hypothetical protein
MMIKRDGKLFMLTPDELEKAYREKEAVYETENAQTHVSDLLSLDPEGGTEFDKILAKLSKTYEDVFWDIRETFRSNYDPDEGEYGQWEIAAEKVIEEIMEQGSFPSGNGGYEANETTYIAEVLSIIERAKAEIKAELEAEFQARKELPEPKSAGEAFGRDMSLRLLWMIEAYVDDVLGGSTDSEIISRFENDESFLVGLSKTTKEKNTVKTICDFALSSGAECFWDGRGHDIVECAMRCAGRERERI